MNNIDDLIADTPIQVVDPAAVPTAETTENAAAPAEKKNKKSKKTDATSSAASPAENASAETDENKKAERKTYTAGVSHPIISGKMPDELVYLIRKEMVYEFAQRDENGDFIYVDKTLEDGTVVRSMAMEAHETPSTGDFARRFGTTVGKIQDVFKFVNFRYVDENFVTTPENIEAAKKWLRETPSSQNKEQVCIGHFDTEARESLEKALDEIPIGNDEQLKEYAVRRSSSFSRSRKSSKKTEGTSADAPLTEATDQEAVSAETPAEEVQPTGTDA